MEKLDYASPRSVNAPPPSWVMLPMHLLAALPVAAVCCFYATAIHAALYLGHWPSYANPDPKTLPDAFWNFDNTLAITVFFVAIVGFVWVPWRTLKRRVSHRYWFLYCGLYVGLAWTCSIVFVLADPFGVLAWSLD